MNQSDFAKLHGVSRKTITAWKARGWLVFDGDEIDVDASNANIEQYTKTPATPKDKAEPKKQSSGLLLILMTNHQTRRQKD